MTYIFLVEGMEAQAFCIEHGGGAKWQFLLPNVRAKRVTTAWRAGQQAQNGPQAQRLMASATCRWRSA